MEELTLQGDRVHLRPLAENDLPPLLAILLEPGVAEWWACYDMARLRADTLDYEGGVSLAIELEGQLIGVILFAEETDPYYRYASIDVTIAAHLLGQGLGTDAVRTVARYLFEERGHHRLTIDPAVENARAIAAYKKVGFKPVGVMRAYEKGADGNWHDNLLMDMLAGELVSAQARRHGTRTRLASYRTRDEPSRDERADQDAQEQDVFTRHLDS